jgi:tetratricopeptide (TPR) repeat protein
MANGPLHPTLRPRAFGGGADRSDTVARAMFALNGQRPQEAQRIAEEVLKSNPRHARALHIFGCALLMQGRAQDAIAPLESAARGRHDPEIETQLAMALSQVGRQEDALTRLKRAIKRQPPYAAAFHGLGGLLLAMERHDEAITVLRRGVEIAPMLPEMFTQLGYALLRRKNQAEAKAAFNRALAISPGSPDALFGAGKAHYDTGENEAAADYFRRGLMGRPDDDNAWLHLGHCLLALGQRDAGYDCFRTAARGDPRRYGKALASLTTSGRGRAWLKPSAAARFLRGEKKPERS